MVIKGVWTYELHICYMQFWGLCQREGGRVEQRRSATVAKTYGSDPLGYCNIPATVREVVGCGLKSGLAFGKATEVAGVPIDRSVVLRNIQ
jgi:hypothetical protein